jgi:tetratricopeptide (TPR) repeat protein
MSPSPDNDREDRGIVERLGVRLLIIFLLIFWAARIDMRPSALPSSRSVVSRPKRASHAPEPDAALPPATITIDYPEDGSIFPPEIAPPTFIWHDDAGDATSWLIEVTFADGTAGIPVKSQGERLSTGEIDPRCVAETNELPRLTEYEASARSWRPDGEIWATIKRHSREMPAALTISGLRDKDSDHVVSRGRITIQTSKDPVGAPIFYRDVPLMPSELERGVIKPIVPSAVPFISWRLRYVGEARSRLLLEGLRTCANCHSFSLDGKTMGMDVDGPQNDKGMYAIVPVKPLISIRDEDIFSWNSFKGKPEGQRTIGFMAQVSPDGQYAVTTLNEAMYVVNFKDYRILQVFYPTRGILAWYNRVTGQMKALPGADNPNFVQTDAFWSPDGSYLVFARAPAKDPYQKNRPLAEYPNDPNETQIQYDLYRIPFNGGRGGRPVPIVGASRNGLSNNFPKVSPDGKWIVFVQCRNGQLLRPDGQLYIIPAEGGQARRMRCNTPLMNSWHSFSPNGRWMVFASKSLSPYTRMFLTHVDEQGRDSPAVLIENATAANRAVNIPEFLNIQPDGLAKIEIPAAEFYRIIENAWALAERGRYDASVTEWKKALQLNPDDAKAHNNLGRVLAAKGDIDEAVEHWQRALQLNPDYAEAHNNLGTALVRKGRFDEAIAHFRTVLETNPESPEVHNNLGRALAERGKLGEALKHWRKAVALNPASAEAHNNLGTGLFQTGKLDEAIVHWQKAIDLSPKFPLARFNLGHAFYLQGKFAQALVHWREGLRQEPDRVSILYQTAWVLATCPETSIRNGAEAVELAERAVRLSGGRDPAVLDSLAAAYAELGRFSEAAQTCRRALALASAQSNLPLTEALKRRVMLYESNRRFRGFRGQAP